MKWVFILILFTGFANATDEKLDLDILGKWLCISDAATGWNKNEDYTPTQFQEAKYMLYITEQDGKNRFDFGPFDEEPTPYGFPSFFRGVYSGHYDRLNESIYYEPARKRFVYTYVNAYLSESSKDDVVVVRGKCEIL